MGGYPAPVRRMWSVMIEFRDGQQVVGFDDGDVIDAWRRLHWLGAFGDADEARRSFKARIVEHARGAYGAVLIGVDGSTPDGPWLDALSAEGCLTAIRK